MQLMTSEISDIAETLDNELDEVKEEGLTGTRRPLHRVDI